MSFGIIEEEAFNYLKYDYCNEIIINKKDIKL